MTAPSTVDRPRRTGDDQRRGRRRPTPAAPRRARVLRRSIALTVVLTFVLAGPASAHPFFRGGEVPVDSLATLTLAMAHGCGSEGEGQGDATTDVAIEVPDWLRIVDVPEPDGWLVELEAGEDGRTAVVNWVADGGEEPAPEFDLDVVARGEVGEERYVSVFQACGDFVYRWVGTPDEPADDPAVRLTLVEADPSSPPPPEPDPEVDEEEAPEVPDDPEPPVEPEDPTDEPDPVDEPPADDEADDPEADDPDEADDLDDADDAAAEGDSVSTWLFVVLAAVLLLAVIVYGVARRNRRNGGAGNAPGAADATPGGGGHAGDDR